MARISVTKPLATFSKGFVANWKGSVASMKSGTAVSTPANLAAIAALMSIATGEGRFPQIVPIRIDYTQVGDPFWLSSNLRQPAIDEQFGAGHEAGCFRGKEDRGLRDFFGLADAT
jgi:hypothetical protein